MGKIIAFANQKGGVGKTTTCVNLSASLATQKKILLVDLDPQGNATMASGISKFDIEKNVYNILMEGTKAEDEILTETTGGYHIIPTNSDLTAAEVGLMNFYARESRLKKALDEIKNRYDFIFIDCPPALNLLTVNALCAADSIIVPMQCEYFSLEGLSALTDTIKQIKENINETKKNYVEKKTEEESKKEIEKYVKKIVASCANSFFKALWLKKDFYEREILNGNI